MTQRRDDPVLHVLPGAGQDEPGTDPATADAAVRDPARALRVATTVRGVLDEIRGTEPCDPVRDRLAKLHDRTVAQLHGMVSDDLAAELDELALADAGSVAAPELRVVLAEIVGWLEGLFHGISADLVTGDDGDESSHETRAGHYL